MLKNIINKLRGGLSLDQELTSEKIRADYSAQGRTIGLYSYGCFDLSRISSGTSIGRYCSFSPTSRTQTRNHGMSFLGLTPYFYEPELGVVSDNKVPFNPIDIGDDVWVGANVVILASCKSIGRGAVIGAGAIVTKPVPAYAVVVGNPARVIKMRFDDATIAAIEATQWWTLDPPALRKMALEQPDLVFSPALHFKGQR